MSFWQILTSPILRWLNHKKPGHDIPLSDFNRIRYELRPCDVILVEGRSRVSDVIRLITQSPWSHAALYIGRLHDIENPAIRDLLAEYIDDPNTQLIIESELGLGTVVCPLEKYRDEHMRLCRPKNLSYPDSQQIIQYGVSKLGHEYDVRQIFDLARLLFPWTILPRRWRSSLFKHNVGTPTKTVCSTMIAEAFGFVQFPILPLVQKDDESGGMRLYRRNPKLCVPRDFDYSPYFEIIKYPFVDFDHHQDYHLLPWRNEEAPMAGAIKQTKQVDIEAENKPTTELETESENKALTLSSDSDRKPLH